MKTILAIGTSCALAAGLIVGYLEHSRSGGAPSIPRPEATRIAPPQKADGKEKPAPEAKSPVKEKGRTEPASKVPPPGQEEIAAAIREIEQLILREDFRAANEVTERLLQKYERNPEARKLLDALRREEKKSKAFAALTSFLETKDRQARGKR